jgi:hypothetical protein
MPKFKQKLSIKNLDFVNKIEQFVSINTLLHIAYFEEYIKFAKGDSEPSEFYISKNSVDKLFVKFRVFLKNSFISSDKVFIEEDFDNILGYIEANYDINKAPSVKPKPQNNLFKALVEMLDSKGQSILAEKQKIDILIQEITSFIESIIDENLVKSPMNGNIDYFLKLNGKKINFFSINRNDGKVPKTLLIYGKKPTQDKHISIESSTNVEEIHNLLLQEYDNICKFHNETNIDNEITSPDPFDETKLNENLNEPKTFNENESFSEYETLYEEEITDEDKSLFEQTTNSGFKKNKYIFVSNKFLNSYKKESKLNKELTDNLLIDVEQAPSGVGFYDFLNQKKVNKIHGFYKIRIDKVKRLLFLYSNKATFPTFEVIDYIPDHDFEKAGIKDIKVEKLTFNLWKTEVSAPVKKIPKLSDLQREIVKENNYPQLVFGAAGSGKTSVSLEKYLHIQNQFFNMGVLNPTKKQLIYLTFNPKMADDIASQIKEFYLLPNTNTIDGFFKEILNENGIKIADFSYFEKWFEKNYLKAFDKPSRDIAEIIDSVNPATLAYTYYRGVFTGSFGINLERLDLSPVSEHLDKASFTRYLQSEAYNQEKIEALWVVLNNYHNHALKNNVVHDNQIALKVLKKINTYFGKYENIIVDETQDLTQVQIYVLLNLAKNLKICFFGDSNQTINPTIFNIGKLNQLIYKITGENNNHPPKILKKTYRSSEGLVEYTNHLVELRKKYIAYQGEETDYHHESLSVVDNIRWAARVRKTDVTENTIQRTLINPNAIVLVPDNKSKVDFLKLFKIDENKQNRVYSIDEAKGLEWDSVVVYKFIGNNREHFAEMLNNQAKKSTFHRVTFNKYYVACTRARNSSIIIEDEEFHNQFAELLNPINLVDDPSLIDNFFNNDLSSRAWFLEGKALFEQYMYNKALISFENAILKDFESNEEHSPTTKEYEYYYGLCNKMNSNIQKNINEIDENLVIELKEKKLFNHLRNLYRNKGDESILKLIRIYEGESGFEKEELKGLFKHIKLSETDVKMLKETSMYKLLEKELILTRNKIKEFKL